MVIVIAIFRAASAGELIPVEVPFQPALYVSPNTTSDTGNGTLTHSP